jgi:uncharacterized protein (TIGR02594 family)
MKPHWLLEAEKELGVHETAGPKANARIMRFWSDAGLVEHLAVRTQGDETPWCAVFVGAMLARCGLAAPHFTLAKQFLGYGQHLQVPTLGAIVILNRPGGASWQGHVGFCTAANDKYVELLGGNQGDAVSVALFSRDRVAGYRWPLGVPVSDDQLDPIGPGGAVNPKDR